MPWSWSTFTSGRRPPAWVSKVICTCFGQSFEEKHIFRRNYICFISLDCRCKKWSFVVGLLITSGQKAKNLRFLGKKIRQIHPNCILCLACKNFEEKNVFFSEKKHNVIFCFGFSARKILVMDEKFMVALLDLLSTCLANMSRMLDNLNIFSQLSGFEPNKVGLLVEDFPQDCRNYIIQVQKIILKTGLLYGWTIFPKFFWIKSVSYLHFWSFFLGRVSIHEFNLSGRMFGEKNFWEKKYKILS